MKHNLILLTVFLFAIACSKTLSSDGDITPATAFQTKSLCSSNSRYAISDKEAERFINSPWASDGYVYSGNKHIFYNFRAL